MPAPRATDVTRLLRAWSAGEPGALDRLVPLVYAELRRLAHHQMQGERPDHALQTTALVHEAYLRLVGGTSVPWRSRIQFYAVSAQIMRRVLVDAARRRRAVKRGGGAVHVSLEASGDLPVDPSPDVVALDEALDALADVDPRKAKVVELRYFAGLGVEETAEAVGVSVQTVMRDWKFARLWLLRELGRGTPDANRAQG